MFLCLLFPFFQQDGELGHSVGGEKVGLRKAPNHTPYLHSRAGQDQTLIKAGYCVKQGALVSLRDFINLGLVELRVCVCLKIPKSIIFDLWNVWNGVITGENSLHVTVFLLFQMKNWKRRYFVLEQNSMSYFKSDLVRCVFIRDLCSSYIW